MRGKVAVGNAGVWSNLGIVVWFVYGYFAGQNRWLAAGLAGAAIAGFIILMQYYRRAVKLMDCTSLGYFTAEVLTVITGGAGLIDRYHLAIVWGVFAIVAWWTIAVKRPFTLQYAREKTPPEFWGHPALYQMNRRLSEVWAWIFTFGSALGIVTLYAGHLLLLGLILPMAAMGFGFIFNQFYPKRWAEAFAPVAAAPAPRSSTSASR